MIDKPLRYFRPILFAIAACWLQVAGCAKWYAGDADREVYGLVDRRQRQALGIPSDAEIEDPKSARRVGSEAYAFVPHPIDPDVPESFTRKRETPETAPAEASVPNSQPATEGAPSDTPTTQTVTQTVTAPGEPAEGGGEALIMGFDDAIKYAFRQNRDFQNAKEDLYLAALALTLERHLWTPQFIAEIQSNFADYGQIRDFDRAMDAVAEVSAEQRLPLGGQVTAQIVSTFMRDLGRHITSGESSQLILSAEIPLLRGAGLVALEDRFQAERDLIYAVRDFERARRNLFVDVASDYLRLMVQKQRVRNAEFSVASFLSDYERAKALNEAGRVDILEVQRAQQNLLVQQNNVVDAQAGYETALDEFKIRIGMPVEQNLLLEDTELQCPVPDVAPNEAIDTALAYRLDLLTESDRVADARRGVRVAANGLLPDLNLSGNVTFDTDPGETNFYQFTEERATWRGGVSLGLPVDRKAERNDYRRAVIDLRRAERGYELAGDRVRRDVRRAIRNFLQAKESLEIQETNIDLATRRREAATIKFELGAVRLRDKVEAEDALRNARNDYARAVSDYQIAILEFRRDTGTLRISDEGLWLELSSRQR
jgi:outer membrane protein TolC